MNPKKVKLITKKTSEELNISESTVDDVISFYWNQVRNEIVNVNSISIRINSLGTFHIKNWKLKSVIEKYEKTIKSLDKYENKYMTFQRHAILANTKDRLKKLKELESQFEEEEIRKKQTKEKREEYINNKNLESKESNS